MAYPQEFNSDVYAQEQNKKLGRGVNIIGYDPIWQSFDKARMKENHFKLIKEAGFDNVRIPLMPFKFSLNETDFSIDPDFFTTLDWIIEQSLKNNLMAIVDFHEHHAMQEDPLGNKAMFLSMWKQIAEHCAKYPKEVLFEICNEPNMKPEIWNEINIEAHNILRESNPNRTIMWGPIYGNQIEYLKDLKMPEDDRNIIVAIHYYMPIQFTHQGAPWSTNNKDLSGIEWKNTESEEQAVKADFDIAQEWSALHKRPLSLGEFGAYDKADMASRVRWTNFIARQAEARNWSWSYWQFDSDFIVYDIDKAEWVKPILNALIPGSK
jgi:endoglucanase